MNFFLRVVRRREVSALVCLQSWATAWEELITSFLIKSWAAALSPGLLALDLAPGDLEYNSLTCPLTRFGAASAEHALRHVSKRWCTLSAGGALHVTVRPPARGRGMHVCGRASAGGRS